MRRPVAQRRLLGAGVSLVAHGFVLLVLLTSHKQLPAAVEEPPMYVALVQSPKPPRHEKPAPPPSPAPASAKPSKAKAESQTRPPPKLVQARLAKARSPDVAPLVVGDSGDTDDTGVASDAQVAAAASAGSGRGLGCDMAGRLQSALRRDARAQAAAAAATLGAGGRALLVWDGRWVRSRGQAGAGLAALREAMLWEIGFAPPACRSEQVRGLVRLSLGDRPGAAQIILGRGSWRWADLLKL
jgi:hypothetical protein